MKKQSGEVEGGQCMRPGWGAHVRAPPAVRGVYVFLKGPRLAAGCAPDRMRVYPRAVRGASMHAPRVHIPPPPEMCTPLMMGSPVYKGCIRLRPFTSALIPGLQLLLSGCLLGSLGAHSHLLPIFTYNLNF
jgi:hypothetical protein